MCTARLPFLKAYVNEPEFVFGLAIQSENGLVTQIQRVDPRVDTTVAEKEGEEEEAEEVIDVMDEKNKRSLVAAAEGESKAKKVKLEIEVVNGGIDCKRNGEINCKRRGGETAFSIVAR